VRIPIGRIFSSTKSMVSCREGRRWVRFIWSLKKWPWTKEIS